MQIKKNDFSNLGNKRIKNYKSTPLAKHKTIKEKTLYLQLERTTKAIREKFNSAGILKSQGLSFEQWLIIDTIGKNEGIHQKLIVQELAKEPASVSRLIQKLVDQKLVSKSKDDVDKKIQHLALTAFGKHFYEESKKSINKEFKELFSSVFEREIYLVIDILKRIK